jgi:hypothetical protein
VLFSSVIFVVSLRLLSACSIFVVCPWWLLYRHGYRRDLRLLYSTNCSQEMAWRSGMSLIKLIRTSYWALLSYWSQIIHWSPWFKHHYENNACIFN